MSRQEEIELCELLAKLLVEMNDESDESDELFDKCIIAFTIARKRVKTTITFEVGEPDE